MKKFVCTVCGYVHTGDSAPDMCPVCKVGADKFVEQTGEMKLAAEHEYGIYAKTVKNNADISAEELSLLRGGYRLLCPWHCRKTGRELCEDAE